MLIGITGKKGSGKDTFASILGFTNVKMADPLKDMLRTLYRLAQTDDDIIERKIEGDLKEVPCEVLCGKTPRHAMQTLGTEWRDGIGKELWSRIWLARVGGLLNAKRPVVCTDIRFHHEAQAIRELGGFMVRVDRPGLATGDVHISEVEMESIPVHYLVTNDKGIVGLHRKAVEIVKELQV